MADKKLTIGVEAKVAPSVQQMVKLMDDFAARGNKAARAFNQVAGLSPEGKATGAAGGLAKALLQEKKLFDDLGKSGERFAKVLNEQVSRSQTALRKQLEESTKGLDALVKKHESAQARVDKLKQSGADPARIKLAEKYAARSGSAMFQGAGDILALKDALGLDKEDAPGASRGQQAGASILAALMGRAGVPMGGTMMAMGGAAGFAAAAAAGAVIGTKIVMSNMSAGVTSAGELGTALGSNFRMTSSFDRRSLYGRQRVEMGEGAADLMYKDDLSKIWHGLKIGGRILTGMDAGEAMDAELRSWQAGTVNRRNERGQSISAAEDATFQRLEQQRQLFRMTWRHGKGFVGDLNKTALAVGLNPMEIAEYTSAVSPLTGARGAVGYAGRVGRAVRSGMDAGSATGIVGATAVAGGDVLRYGAGYDPSIRAILGQAAASTMGANTMMFRGAGDYLADSLAGGINTPGGPMGVRQAQQAAMGASIYGQAFAGHDPFQKSYNIAAASASLSGTNASSYTRNFLATQMSDPKVLSAVMAGKLPDSFRYMGITLDQAQRTARDVDRGLVQSRWYDTGEKSIAADRMREIRAAGGPMAWALSMKGRSAKDREQALQEAAPLLAQVEMGLTGGDVGAGEAMLRRAMGLAVPQSKRARGKGGAAAAVSPDDWHESMSRDLKAEVESALKTITNVTDGLDNLAKVTRGAVSGVRNLGDQATRALGRPGVTSTKPRGQ